MPAQQPEPRSVANAVKLMYAGAAVSVIEIVLTLTTISGFKSAIRKAYPHYTPGQVHTAEIEGITLVVIISLIGVGLWILMARLNAAGVNWARIVATVLFGFYTLRFVSEIVQPHAMIGLLLPLALWLVGLAAIVLLWRAESSPYFHPGT